MNLVPWHKPFCSLSMFVNIPWQSSRIALSTSNLFLLPRDPFLHPFCSSVRGPFLSKWLYNFSLMIPVKSFHITGSHWHPCTISFFFFSWYNWRWMMPHPKHVLVKKYELQKHRLVHQSDIIIYIIIIIILQSYHYLLLLLFSIELPFISIVCLN